MIYKKFRVNCIIRVLFLCASIYFFFYLLLHTALLTTTFIIGFIVIYQCYTLVRYVEKTNRDLTRFLQSIKYADFSQTFTTGLRGTSFTELNAAFSDVVKEFQRARAEKEEHFRYLRTVVQHIGIGLISYQQNGDVELVNNAAKRLFNISNLRNIRALEFLSKPLVEKLLSMKSGEKNLIRVIYKDEIYQLAIYTTRFKLRNYQYTLASIQNIQNELEEKEMEAWQNLIRVLTHEIMNSITPICSLTATANSLLASLDGNGAKKFCKDATAETIDDIRAALQTIEKRSQGLLRFVDAYRNLTRIPKPNFKLFAISDLFARVNQLMAPQFLEKKIHFHLAVSPQSLELTADPELIEQVLINLLVNSIHAIQDQRNARIELSGSLDKSGRIILQVTDNGPGIIPEARDKLFVPFFTTKKKGSGIGLSLSRQIMKLHKGTISFQSEPNVQTVFTLKF